VGQKASSDRTNLIRKRHDGIRSDDKTLYGSKADCKFKQHANESQSSIGLIVVQDLGMSGTVRDGCNRSTLGLV
jgi:hypothetical protein